ncbi:hypothetical protein Tcan_03687 [Toxocara canis]|uniref:Uncharacterized protein n=1 Tax=Toxocara canis TaxID=6265 RepID=A0A0B2W0C3_TOXCA|nr:hypothetical protein Tcan_03687 [Toxocara canis]
MNTKWSQLEAFHDLGMMTWLYLGRHATRQKHAILKSFMRVISTCQIAAQCLAIHLICAHSKIQKVRIANYSALALPNKTHDYPSYTDNTQPAQPNAKIIIFLKQQIKQLPDVIKRRCARYLAENRISVLRSKEWEQLKKRNPELAIRLLELSL